jgi:hypothetical protein
MYILLALDELSIKFKESSIEIILYYTAFAGAWVFVSPETNRIVEQN